MKTAQTIIDDIKNLPRKTPSSTKDVLDYSGEVLSISQSVLRSYRLIQTISPTSQGFANYFCSQEMQKLMIDTRNTTKISEVRTRILLQYQYITYQKLSSDDIHVLQNVIVGFVDDIESRRHSDQISSCLSAIAEKQRYDTKKLVGILQQRNISKNERKRRQSIVSLLYYSRMRKEHIGYEEAIRLIDNLIDDTSYYVQKGVGRTLRELYNVYPDKTLEHIYKHAQAIHPAARYASTEKLDKETKETVMSKRKK